MGVALHGNLQDFGLAEVFQLIGQQRKTGVLEITHRRVTMRLQFEDGAVVTASPDLPGSYAALGDLLVRCGLITRERLEQLLSESQTSARALPDVLVADGEVTAEQMEEMIDLLTQETVFQVLRWTEGSFHFSASAVAHDRPPERLLAAEQILMDGLRMVDEWRTFAERVPSAETVFERSGAFAIYRERARGESARRLAQAEQIFHLVDGRLNVRRVIDLSRLGTFEGTRILAELRRVGVIEPVDAREVRRIRHDERGLQPIWERVRLGLAAAGPLAALAVAVALVFGEIAGAPVHRAESLPGWEIPRAPFVQAHQEFEVRRLRNAVEAHRYLHGRWPESLESLAVADGDASGALAPSGSGSYYYAASEEGVTLLAPPR